MPNDGFAQEVTIIFDQITLPGTLTVPAQARGIVIFSHGSGSSRLSPRNRFVAEELNRHDIGTLLFDLLTPEEDIDYANRFDIPRLTERLVDTTRWLTTQPIAAGKSIGYFGASTGAASALYAAAKLGEMIRAVVSRGGRPDLAEEALPRVTAPTLLIVGGADIDVLALNRAAYARLAGVKGLTVVENATHLFEEAGALEHVARDAAAWFEKYL